MDQSMRALLAEFLGAFVLLFFGGLSILASGGDLVVISFGFGFALLAGLYAFGEISGGHFNPAVSLGAFLDKRIDVATMVQYWVAQLAGFVVAGLGLLIASDQDAVASTATKQTVGVGSALLLEIVLTAVFVGVILAVTKSNQFQGAVFSAISLTLVGIHFAAAPLSGASVNPGRTLGSAIIGSEFADIWIYLVGPLVGALIGWVLYRLVYTGEVDSRID
ncbi:MAG: MIP/aquaporin family protein [Acidimicrobiia bacterium]|nr:MIP/aquaporin family protein [Acidimicrobiia bacterium]